MKTHLTPSIQGLSMTRMIRAITCTALLFCVACDKKTEEPAPAQQNEVVPQSAGTEDTESKGLTLEETVEVKTFLDDDIQDSITSENAEASANALAAELEKELEELN